MRTEELGIKNSNSTPHFWTDLATFPKDNNSTPTMISIQDFESGRLIWQINVTDPRDSEICMTLMKREIVSQAECFSMKAVICLNLDANLPKNES